jgi:quercetin dioxygenase-like cupin family protein
LYQDKKAFMELKRNEATLNRPEGDRVIDAPYVFMDLGQFIKQIKNEETWDKNDRNVITIFKTENLTTVLTCLHKDALIKDNSVDGILQVQVLGGRIRVTTADGDIDMEEGKMIVFHPGIRHTIEALKKSSLLLQTINENGKKSVF